MALFNQKPIFYVSKITFLHLTQLTVMPGSYPPFPQLSLRCHFQLICPNYDLIQNHAMPLVAMLLKSLFTQKSFSGQNPDLLKIPGPSQLPELFDHSLSPWYFCELEIRSKDLVSQKLNVLMKRTREVVLFISVIIHQEIHASMMTPPLMMLTQTWVTVTTALSLHCNQNTNICPRNSASGLETETRTISGKIE